MVLLAHTRQAASSVLKLMADQQPKEAPDDGTPTRLEPQVSGPLHSLIVQAHACQYHLAEYFVAWQGVLTLACSGIPPSLCKLKQNISVQLHGIAKENPGSKWPKISLGCLRDGQTLSLKQLFDLRNICSEEIPILVAAAPVVVDNLSVVLFGNRCLEKTITVATIPLALPADLSTPSPEERAHVRGVLEAFAPENIASYHSFTSMAGNRSTHYKSSKVGATVVHFLGKVPVELVNFRARIDSLLPGMYDWFADESLHITVRALF